MAVLVSDLINLINQKGRDSVATDKNNAEKTVAIEETLLDLNANDILPGAYETQYVEYADTLTHYPAPARFRGFVEAEPEQRITSLNIVSPEEFSLQKRYGVSDMIASKWQDDSIIWRLKTNVKSKQITLQLANSATGNGTWTADTTNSDASNVLTDINVYPDDLGGSVSFDLTVGQSANNRAEISNSGFTAVDLSTMKNKSLGLFELFIPDATYITSVDLFWGTSASNYYTKNETKRADGAAFKAGWNPMKFKWADSTTTGSSTDTSIGYVAIRINYSASQTSIGNFRIANIRFAPIEIVPVSFASTAIAKNSAGTLITALSQTVTTDVMLFSEKMEIFKNVVVYGAVALLSDQEDDQESHLAKDAKYQSLKAQLVTILPPRMKYPENTTRMFVNVFS